MKKFPNQTVTLQKVVYGGQTLAELEDGKKVFVWGGLPGETVEIEIFKSKKTWAEAKVVAVTDKSKSRIEPEDPYSYLSTSPWQIYDYNYENELKQTLISEQFEQHGIKLELAEFSAPEECLHYRNKVEFSFWWDNDTEQLDLAFFKRGTHFKQPVDGTILAKDCINQAAVKIRDYLRESGAEARDLKTLIIRCNQEDTVIAQLYVKEESFKLKPKHDELGLAGISIHFSNPKSPASIITKTLYESGAQQLSDSVLDVRYSYAVEGFFQVSIPMYESALEVMAKFVDKAVPLVDLYSGVGSIGLSLAGQDQQLTLVETDERCVTEAKANADLIKSETEVIHAKTETALEYIDGKSTVILDPPRSGLHEKVIDRILEVKPITVLYLSCNPATQARDVALLKESYKISYSHGFNFFPRTPHIENLVVLEINS